MTTLTERYSYNTIPRNFTSFSLFFNVITQDACNFLTARYMTVAVVILKGHLLKRYNIAQNLI